MTRVLIYGGRDFRDRARAFAALDALHAERRFTAVVEGGASGADRLGREWGLSRGLPVETFDAEWGNLDAPGAVIRVNGRGPYNARAGADRNLRMFLRGRPEVAVEFPGGDGTANMRSILKGRVHTWRPDVELIEA